MRLFMYCSNVQASKYQMLKNGGFPTASDIEFGL